MSSNKQILHNWDEFRRNLLADTAIDWNISAIDIMRHREQLEDDIVEWIVFFMQPKYPFAKFHKRFFRRVVKAVLAGKNWFEVLSWARELAKTTCVMYIMLYFALIGKKKNIVLTSANWDNAADYLEQYRAQLDTNQRIIAYYGEQKNLGSWEYGDFTTRNGVRFLAKGKGQTPRGTKSGDIRPDAIIPDDFDTDESVRNPDTVNADWEWFEQALYPTRSISEPLLVLWNGNIIAQDCCVARAGKIADHHDIVNIRDENGESTWPEKNTEEKINDALKYMSTKAIQQEYYNNPLVEGDIFKNLVWGKCPPLSKLDFVVSYSDPSPSNKDKQKKGVSFKANSLIGYYEGKFYIYTCFLEQAKSYDFVEWNWFMRNYVRERTQILYYIENNTLQNPFYEQVYVPLFDQIGRERGMISITPDTRIKPEKPARIEGNLEGLDRQGLLVFNEAEKENPHMQRLHEQFKLFTPQLHAPADGPDSVEGGVWILNQKIQQFSFKPSFGRVQHKGMY